MPRAIAIRLSLVIGAACLAWATIALITGGFDVRPVGIRLSSHDPLKPLLAAALALTVRVLLGGTIPLGWLDTLARPLQRIRHQHIGRALAIGIFGVGVAYGT